MQRFILNILIMIVVVAYSSAASTINVPVMYQRFRETENKELMKLGAHYDMANQPDSALVCYSIVNERLSNQTLSHDDQIIYCRALTNLGFLYASYFFDYTKAMWFFQKSNEESLQAGYTSNLAYNYLNMAGVYLACTQIYRNQLFEEEIWKYCDKAIETAIQSEEWEVALAAMANAGMLELQHPQPQQYLKLFSRIRSVKIPEKVNMRNFYLTFMTATESFSQKKFSQALDEFRQLEEMVNPGSMLKSCNLPIQ